MNNMSVVGMMNSMVPITRFNKGEATKIFEEVELTGTKIVVKNNKPACILISPSQYESLMETLSDYMLYTEAENRMANINPGENISHEDLMKEHGITQDDLDGVDVEIE
ncbi:MAG TPA: prevent-host-death protein [Ruminococcus sp.]|nr:prevent-host-death protein [Ruminococcus sp.]